MNTNSSHLRAFALLTLVMVFWAGNSIVARAVRFDVGPFTLAFVRWAGASLLLAPFAWGGLRREWPVLRRHWKAVLLLGLMGIGAFNTLLYVGLQYTAATNALLLQAAIPAAVVLVDRMAFGTRATGLQLAGIAASILGVVVIVFEGDPRAALRLHFGLGDGLVLSSVLVWSLYTVFLRLRPPVSPTTFVAATFLVGVVVLAPFAAWEWSVGREVRWSPSVGLAFLYVAVLPSTVSYFIYNHAAHVVGPARAGQAITLMPLFGAFLSTLLLGERLHPYHFAGMAFIVAGIAIGILAARKQAAGAGAARQLEDRA
ncbi:permease [Altererythrobacter sp. B11]|uniref:DMT family transporter n=1 Tax=Altererythrobacter sp. B11 TaxID=2060312 RepID=UPI000DC6D1FC|nr:DMT family transporter [Altererythrobacter sp. B11]BBC74454.1 permease [Altererythrobacter sp. B11]